MKLTKPPKLVTFVQADFPSGETAGASVVLALTIGSDGKVRDVQTSFTRAVRDSTSLP